MGYHYHYCRNCLNWWECAELGCIADSPQACQECNKAYDLELEAEKSLDERIRDADSPYEIDKAFELYLKELAKLYRGGM